MVWDATAYAYTIHALGAVEASMDYGATNPTDVISVGLLQWYAQRAANVLDQMKSTNPSDWTVSSSLTNDLTTYPANDNFWSNRYLTASERSTLHTTMNTSGNKAVQDNQAQTDIDNTYIPAGAKVGIDKDATPETMAFFINIFNRNPTAARRIVGNCGPDSSLNRIYSYTINDTTEQYYKTRYSMAKTIIANHDTTGVGIGTDNPPPTTPGGDGGGGSNGQRPTGNAAYIQQRGGDLVLFNKDKTKLMFKRSGPDIWLSGFDNNTGTPPVVDPPTAPPPAGVIADIIAWEMTKIGAYEYSQGSGRLNPEASGYTDCSGLHYYAYKKIGGIYIGTWTGDQIGHGHLITKSPSVAKDGSTVIPGDLIFFRWGSNSPSSFDHVEMYQADDNLLSHGGPGNGPHLFTLTSQVDEAINAGGSIEVRRYV